MILESRANSASARQASREARLSRLPAIGAQRDGRPDQLPRRRLRHATHAGTLLLPRLRQQRSQSTRSPGQLHNPDRGHHASLHRRPAFPRHPSGREDGGGRHGHAGAHRIRRAILASPSAYLDALLADRFEELAQRARETTLQHVKKARGLLRRRDDRRERPARGAGPARENGTESDRSARNGASLARAALNRAMGIEQDRSFRLDDLPVPL